MKRALRSLSGNPGLAILLAVCITILFSGCLDGGGNGEASDNGTAVSGDGTGKAEKDGDDAGTPSEEKDSEYDKGSPAHMTDSIYTDLAEDKCRTTDLDEESESSTQICPGAFGYRLEVVEGDLRQTVNVISGSGERHELRLWSVVSGAFSFVGEKAEWRFHEVEGDRIPFALIIRFNASENPEDSSKVTSYLTVSKITDEEICVTDIVKPIKNANVEARRLAEKAAEKPCLD